MKKGFLLSVFFSTFMLGVRAAIEPADLLDETKLIAIIGQAGATDNDRVTACQNLGWCGGEAAIAPLAALLDSDKPFLRHAARYGLEMIPLPRVAETLNQAAGRLSGAPLTGVVQSLGNRGNERSAEILAGLIGGQDQAVARAAAQALGKLATPAAREALQAGLGKCEYAAAALLDSAFQLEHSSPGKAAPLYAALRQAKDNIPVVVAMAALRGEIVTSGREGLALWTESITSGDHAVLDVVLRAVLDYPKGSGATKLFAAALARQRHPAVVEALVAVLGQRGDRAAVPALKALAESRRDQEPALALMAASAMATLNDPAALPPLLALAGNSDNAIAQAAQNEIMGFVGKAADKAVLSMLKESGSENKLAGVEMAVRRRMAVAVPALVKLTSADDAQVVDAAVRAIGDLGGSPEIPTLLGVIKNAPESETAIRALSSLCSRYARPRGGKTIIKSALYGNFEANLTRDVTENVQKLVDAGSITIQASGRLCRWDGFSEDPAPGKAKTLRLVYLFDDAEKSAAVRENDSYHLSGVTLLPEAMKPIEGAYNAAAGAEKGALFRVLVSLANEQALAIARAAGAQSGDTELRERAIRALIEWRTPDALADTLELVRGAPSDRLKILALRGFARQLELAFTVPNTEKLAQLDIVRNAALRDEDRALIDATIKQVGTMIAEEGFKSMFDGNSLAGWKGGGGWWQAKDGILQAQSSEEKPCKRNSHLIWSGGEPADFEMRAEFKLSPNANSGIQLRARDNENADSGYQADMNGNGKYVGFLYHPKQHLVGERGAKVVIAANGEKKVERFADSEELGDRIFKKDDWNEYIIIARGPTVTLFVNGMKSCELTDLRPEMMPSKGFITLQMHSGPPMKIQFRNLRIKEL